MCDVFTALQLSTQHFWTTHVAVVLLHHRSRSVPTPTPQGSVSAQNYSPGRHPETWGGKFAGGASLIPHLVPEATKRVLDLSVCPAAIPHAHPCPNGEEKQLGPRMRLWNRKCPLPGHSPDPGQEQRRPRASTRPSPASAATGAAPTVLLRGGSRVHCLRVDSSEVATRARTRVVSGLALTEAKVLRTSLRQGWRPAADCARSAFGAVTLSPVEAPREERAVTRAARTTPPARPALGGGRGPPAALRRRAGRDVEPRAAHRAETGSRRTAGASQHPPRAPPQPKYSFCKDAPAASPLASAWPEPRTRRGRGREHFPHIEAAPRSQSKELSGRSLLSTPRCLKRRVWVTSPRNPEVRERCIAMKVPRPGGKGNGPALSWIGASLSSLQKCFWVRVGWGLVPLSWKPPLGPGERTRVGVASRVLAPP